MLIIPSIELENGICTKCISGEPGTEHVYTNFQNKPAELVKLLRKENFKALHLIDKDSLVHNKAVDFDLIKELCGQIDIPVEIHANFRNEVECNQALKSGIYRIVISNELILDKDLCQSLMKRHSASRINFALVIDNEKSLNLAILKLHSLEEIIDKIISYGSRRIIIGSYKSIFSDDNFDFNSLSHIFEDKKIRTTLYGGVSTPEQIWEIHRNKSYNIDSVIIGTPLLNNNFPCQKIWRLIEAELEKNKN